MILERITLTNFRCFDSLELPLDPHLNVFVGGNGSGKSTILQAIAIGLAPILVALPIEEVSGVHFWKHSLPKIQLTDIRIIRDDRSAPAAAILVDARFEEKVKRRWTLEQPFSSRTWESRLDKKNALGLIAYGEGLTKKHNAGEAYLLPVFAFYGTDRSVSSTGDKRRDEKLPQFFRRLAGMGDALSPVVDFQRAIGWFDLLERRDLRDRRDSGGAAGGAAAFDAVRQAIATMIDGIANPRIDGETGRFVVDQATPSGEQAKLFLDQLSDGYQVLLGVVMDFAIRLALASPPGWTAGEILAAEAILIIDEVDLHLHPAWQQQVIPRLRQTFPNTQIILTTHSPQVLSTVEAKYIRQITRVGGATMLTPPPSQTRGVASASVMAEVQHVDPVPRVAEAEWLNQYRAMIAEGTQDSDEGRAIRGRLDAHFGPTHHLMLDLDRTLRFYEFKRRVALENA